MKNTDINIRDPFVLFEDGIYYLYGTRAENFGQDVGGFDVYTSTDLENWSEPIECFNSIKNNMNTCVNWAPEVHKYKDAYYMFASFTQIKNGLRGTFVLKADNPLGPFCLHSDGAVTPDGWECIDGTLYVEDDVPYLVFCHEHTQIFDGGMCYIELSEDLTHYVGEPVTMFTASEPVWVKEKISFEHYITDGPFMYRTKDNVLLMIWSTFINGEYAECLVRFNDGTIKGSFEHLEPLIDDDGGHGMLFRANDKLYLTYHTPNISLQEHPEFIEIIDNGNTIKERV